MMRTLRSLRFLISGPIILAALFVVNLVTAPGNWWIKWPAVFIAIIWVISLIRVITAIIAVGGLAAFLAYLNRSRR